MVFPLQTHKRSSIQAILAMITLEKKGLYGKTMMIIDDIHKKLWENLLEKLRGNDDPNDNSYLYLFMAIHILISHSMQFQPFFTG